MNYSFVINKLTLWKSTGWSKVDLKPSRCVLRIHYDQLFITSNEKVIETFSLNRKIKGIFKGDVLILITHNDTKELRKIKFQIKSNVEQCLQILGQSFSLINHETKRMETTILQYRNFEKVLTNTLASDSSPLDSISLPRNYDNFVKLCLLDPTFSDLVKKTQNILEMLK